MSTVGPRRVGKYRLLTQLGSGGMADVYLGIDDDLAVAKLVVVKRVRSHLADDAEFRALLLEEARVCARLNHPNIVQVLDVGFEGGECFLAMEYLDGQSLSQVTKRAHGELPADVELLVVCDVLRALNYAHDLTDFDGTPLSIIHRDVSPQNIFVTYDGAVKLLDFGIAKAAGRASETREGFIRGKLRYMAPEYLRGREIDRRFDVFAAGILVWQAVTDSRFWGDLPDSEIMHKLARHDFDPSPRSHRPDIPEALDRICRRALAGLPEDRYKTAGEMLADLEDYLGNRVVDLRRALVTILRETFGEERQKRRAVIEEASATTTIGNALGSIAIRAARTTESLAVQPIVTGPTSADSDASDETRSLANMLEPTAAKLARRPRTRDRVVALLTVSTVAAVAAAIGITIVRPRLAEPSVAAQEPSTASDEKVAVTFASDDIVALAQPVSATSASVSSPTVKPPPAPVRRRPVGAPGRFAASPPTKTSAPATASTAAKPTVDTSDPWH